MSNKKFSRCLAIAFTGILLSMLIGCTTQQKNTQVRSTSKLPLHVKEILVVYENSAYRTETTDAESHKGGTIEEIDRRLEKAVTSKIPGILKEAGIDSEVITSDALAGMTPDKYSMPWVQVLLLSDIVTCRGQSSNLCSHRLTVEVRLLAANSRGLLWKTQIQEPYFVSIFIYDLRYEELAGYIAKAILGVVHPGKARDANVPKRPGLLASETIDAYRIDPLRLDSAMKVHSLVE